MTAATDRRNWIRSLMVDLAAAMPDVQLIPDGDDQAPTASPATWVRVTVQDASADAAGQRGGAHVARRKLMVTADVFRRGLALDGTSAVDDVEGIAARVSGALSQRSIPVRDYVANPAGAPPIWSTALRFVTPATVSAPASLSGIQRRQVTATAVLLHEV